MTLTAKLQVAHANPAMGKYFYNANVSARAVDVILRYVFIEIIMFIRILVPMAQAFMLVELSKLIYISIVIKKTFKGGIFCKHLNYLYLNY